MSEYQFILTTQEHRACHNSWQLFRRGRPDLVRIIKGAYCIAEGSVRSFGPHIRDVPWIKEPELYTGVYGGHDPVRHLLDTLNFPDHYPPIVDRDRYCDIVRHMIMEHEEHGSDGVYMPRSVVLGWLCRQADLILSEMAETQ